MLVKLVEGSDSLAWNTSRPPKRGAMCRDLENLDELLYRLQGEVQELNLVLERSTDHPPPQYLCHLPIDVLNSGPRASAL